MVFGLKKDNSKYLKSKVQNLLNKGSTSCVILFENLLTEIPVFLFKNMENLEYLDLSNNQLTEVPVSLFRNNKKLKYLDLRNNNLSVKNKMEIRLAYRMSLGKCGWFYEGLCL